ncbi:hypothetical protein [Streptomyces sp. NPDC005181]|uniref:hypothetical protein n=1 Tax=Streptomyces sp. NPDC005181 TaxID=3156869 RepID=UPI0033A1D00D
MRRSQCAVRLHGARVFLLSTHDVADLAEEADHVTVMRQGSVLRHGTTDTFLALTPPGTVVGRAAEGAYTALLRSRGVSA